MGRREFSPKVRVAAFKRCGGNCEGCTARLSVGKFAYDHRVPDQLGGEPTLENCQVLCNACHGAKTAGEDVPRIAKAKRAETRHLGARLRSRGFPAVAPKRTASRPLERWTGAPPLNCTCHPSDNPPKPCPQRHALTDCRLAAPPPNPAAALGEGRVTEEIKRLDEIIAKLDGLETLPKPYDFYYAVKNEGDGTGWRYPCAGFGLSDLKRLRAALAVQPAPETLDRATLEAAIEKLDGDSLDAICEVIGSGPEFREYNKGKSMMRGWFLTRLRALPSASTTAQSGWLDDPAVKQAIRDNHRAVQGAPKHQSLETYKETRTVAIEADGTKRLLPRDW